jgi:hypothetical protein
MGAAGIKTVTIEEYLSNPAYKHCEYVDGEVVELNVGTNPHSRITARCSEDSMSTWITILSAPFTLSCIAV